MSKLRCKNCNYNFEAERIPNLCPNCGEEKSIYQERSAEELVGEDSE